MKLTERGRTAVVVIATAALFMLVCAFMLMTTGGAR